MEIVASLLGEIKANSRDLACCVRLAFRITVPHFERSCIHNCPSDRGTSVAVGVYQRRGCSSGGGVNPHDQRKPFLVTRSGRTW